MEKKNYVKPSMEVYKLKGMPQILVGSNWGGEGGYLPTIPGQPEDEKHLA